MEPESFLACPRGLLAIPSTADCPEELQRALEFVLDVVGPGFTVEQFESRGKPSALVYLGPSRPYFRVVFNAHLDVVLAPPEQFQPRLEGARRYGRSTHDMKVSALVQAMVFGDLEGRMDYPITLQLVTDEEVGGRDGTLHQLEHGVSGEFVIIGEQSLLRVVTESRGLLTLTAYPQAEGRSGHSAYQWRGDNAVLKLMSSLDKLLGSYPVATEEVWRTTVNLARIETTNRAVNRAPADAQAWWDIRFSAEDTDLNGRTVNEITEHLATFCVPSVTVTMSSVSPPHWVDRSPAPRGTTAAARCTESWYRRFTFLLPTRHRHRHLRYRWRWLARPAQVRRHHHGRTVLLGTHCISHRPGLLRPVTRPPVTAREPSTGRLVPLHSDPRNRKDR